MSILFKDFTDSRELSTPVDYINTMAKQRRAALDAAKQNEPIAEAEVEQFAVLNETNQNVVEQQAPAPEPQAQVAPQPEAGSTGNIFDAPQPVAESTGNIFDAQSTVEVNPTPEVKPEPAVEPAAIDSQAVSINPEPVTNPVEVDSIQQEAAEIQPVTNDNPETKVLSAEEIGAEQEQPKKQEGKFPSGHSTVYKIEEGDNVYNLSSKWGISADEIIDKNGLTPVDDLKPGELLIIPFSEDKISKIELEIFSELAQKVQTVIANQKDNNSGTYGQLLDVGEMKL